MHKIFVMQSTAQTLYRGLRVEGKLLGLFSAIKFNLLILKEPPKQHMQTTKVKERDMNVLSYVPMANWAAPMVFVLAHVVALRTKSKTVIGITVSVRGLATLVALAAAVGALYFSSVKLTLSEGILAALGWVAMGWFAPKLTEDQGLG
ncbi:hypothetical protein HA052_04765 [Chromobacterium haemolyticum]|uniref:Uncharacterized protein n=1 Tax=Chromobacterium fluminis TaxID=3044269 RepID=A0ABX0LAV4_9NEIS|nr:hypothetical protein [Chromobacterium haemolyticum]NHR04502.1 hypothetical protein [Chromobacterium haemolyticum]